MSIAHRQPLNDRMQCTTPTVMHSGRRYKASRPFRIPLHKIEKILYSSYYFTKKSLLLINIYYRR